MSDKLIKELEAKALKLRKVLIQMIAKHGSGHCGPALSCLDLLVALYFQLLKVNPKDPYWGERDRFILSKGHGCAALYVVLAEKGFLPREVLDSFCTYGSILAGHPDCRKIPGVDASTGSLGHGLSIGTGMAFAAKADNKMYRVFVLLSDGEMDAGSTWEAAMSASHYRLDNLIALVDRNSLQASGPTAEIMDIEPLVEKWKSFNWLVSEINGHHMGEIITSVKEAMNNKRKPTIIIARTIKGKGISFMENQAAWHYRAPTVEETKQALEELERKEKGEV